MGLRELFQSMVDFFNRERMEFAVIGAFGLQAIGYVRATRDIDFLTRIEYQEKIVRHLSSLGFDTVHRTTAFTNHVHPVGNTRIDVMYVEGATADTMLSSTEKAQLLGSSTVPVVSPEHLIALKLFAAHNDAQRKFREFADIQQIMRRVNVDTSVVREYFKKYGFEDFYGEISGDET